MAEHLLKGKKGIIFGALNDQSIAWKTALQAHAQGAELVLTNAPVAMRMGEIHNLAKQVGDAPVIPADATSVEDLTNLFEQAMQHFGGQVDFVLHSIGMSPNVRKGKHYTDINYNWLSTTLDVSAISLHKTLAVAKKMDALFLGEGNFSFTASLVNEIKNTKTSKWEGSASGQYLWLNEFTRCHGAVGSKERPLKVVCSSFDSREEVLKKRTLLLRGDGQLPRLERSIWWI